MTPEGRGQFEPPVSLLAGIIMGITKHCFTQNVKALGLMVVEKKKNSMGGNAQGHGQFEPQRHDWQDLCMIPLNIATYQIYRF